jgi:hypothetical protein
MGRKDEMRRMEAVCSEDQSSSRAIAPRGRKDTLPLVMNKKIFNISG